MKVVHVSYSDNNGGAAIAALRHHLCLKEEGFDSKMIVIERGNGDPGIIEEPSMFTVFWRKVVYKLFKIIFKPFGTWSLNLSGKDLAENRVIKEADVIILHWVNSWMLSIKSIQKLLETGKPIYWFMHDMWPLTGGCHYSMECEKFKSNCEKCPHLRNLPGIDLARIQFDKKLNFWTGYKNLYFVTPSQWLADRVKESRLFGSNDVSVAGNVIDTRLFNIRDKEESRRRLGLPVDKKLILFGADNISSPYKGWTVLEKVMKMPIGSVEFIVYGSIKYSLKNKYGVRIHEMGKISNIDILIDLYNSADMFVTPTLADNYPNVILESQACGLPTVAFPTGGVPEMITHGVDGYITEEKNAEHLLKGIKWVLDNKNIDRELIRKKALEKQIDAGLKNILMKRKNMNEEI